ncbi:MAG: DUF4293 domain-containing protein [Bacteroidetes bacterium]|nr:DUF4293 domain-containing protein [Bacteroidota bacterium]
MIQRIQTLWLLLAAIFNGLLFFIPVYKYNIPNQVYSPWNTVQVNNYIPLFILAALITVLPLVSIFFFKNRKRQISMVWISILSMVSFFALLLIRVSNLKNGSAATGNFQYTFPGIFVVLLALICCVLALRNIRKDEQLIKSMDRLR